MQHAEKSRNKEQRGYRCEQESSDHGPSQRSVLLAAVSHSHRHGHHADNHGQGGHQHRTKTCVPRLQGGRDNGAPGLRADYSPTYYAAFMLDPDGNNVEAVCT